MESHLALVAFLVVYNENDMPRIIEHGQFIKAAPNPILFVTPLMADLKAPTDY